MRENVQKDKGENMIEVDLIKGAQKGDEDAISEIYKRYDYLIKIRSRNFFIYGGDGDDIIQEGMIGLSKAIAAYDHEKAASFKTFASLCIKRQIITAIKNSNSNKHKMLRHASGEYFDGDELRDSHNRRSFNFYTPEEVLLGREKVEGLEEKLRKNLSKMEKEIFEYMVKGYDYIEISKKTGRQIKTIDNTIQRVKKKMKTYMKDQ